MYRSLVNPMNNSQQCEDIEVAELQTDIMRFMAILSFCLMAIFAVVQSLSYEGEQNTESLDSYQKVMEQTASEKDRLQQEVKLLQEQLKSVQQKHQQQVKNTKQLSEKLHFANSELSQEKNKSEQLQERLNASQSLKSKPITQQNLAEAKPTKKQPLKPVSPPVKPEKKKGFSLGFASDSGFLNSLKTGRVKLYLVSGNQAWLNQGGFQWQKVSSPGKIYEMAEMTVPRSVKQSANNAGALKNQSSHKKRVWGVSLPVSIQSQIQQIMRENRETGGEIVINENGSVKLQRGLGSKTTKLGRS